MNRNLEDVGPTISAFMLIDSHIYNPEYDFRLEVRDPALPPSLTLLLKVFIYFLNLSFINYYSIFNLFLNIEMLWLYILYFFI